MKKNLLLGMGAVLVVGVGAWAYQNNRGPGQLAGPGDGPMNLGQKQNQVSGGKMKTTLKELVGSQQNYQCTYSYQDEATGQLSEGTVYISNQDKKFRGDFNITVDGLNQESHMINDGQFVYIWTTGEKNGIKTPLDPEETDWFDETEESAVNMPEDANEAEQLAEEYEYDCQAWKPSSDVLTPPTEINFHSLMMLPEED